MHAQPDTEVRAFLRRVAMRTRALMAIRAAAAALAIAALLTLAGIGANQRSALVGVAVAILAAAMAAGLSARSHARVAAGVELKAPACRNLLITANELLQKPRPVPAYVRDRVMDDAARLTRRLDVAALVPAARPLALAVAAAIVWTGALVTAGKSPHVDAVARPSSETAAVVTRVDVEVTPPDYSGLPSQSLRDPGRIDALEGSRLRLSITADAARLALETVSATAAIEPAGPQTFVTTVLADRDGFLALTPAATTGAAGVRRLIGLSVTPDALPRVRVTAPAKDMLIASGRQTVGIGLEAEDDLGLATLKLRYTRVAGSGESFTFTDGDVPIEIARKSDRAWTATARWRLDDLKLEPGDMVIYRGIATDRRPGAPAAESDTFVIEIAAPGALASEGFAIDDRQDKYAISQQMVILKTERLLAKRASMPAADFRDEAAGLAAEQRQVRAEFVFMMGGELADVGIDLTTLNEEAEAQGEEDLAAGRMANQGRADLIRAIRAMSRAAARLAEPDVPAALPIEKQALAFLQRAFSRSRYILRTLSERERLDLSRRLTGALAALARNSRPEIQTSTSPRVVALSRALADVAALASDPARTSATGAARAAVLAQRLLQIDPASAPLRDIAATLTGAAGAQTIDARLDRAATALAIAVRNELASAPARSADPALSALDGALADALRASRRKQ